MAIAPASLNYLSSFSDQRGRLKEAYGNGKENLSEMLEGKVNILIISVIYYW